MFYQNNQLAHPASLRFATQSQTTVPPSPQGQVSNALARRALILSDDAEAARVWSYALTRRGIEPAIREINQTSTLETDFDGHDLIIIDHYGPETDIFPLCQQVRANSLEPILLVTYATDERFHLKAYGMGVEECVVKPIGIPLLVAKTLAWLNRATVRKTETRELQVADFRIDPQQRLLTTPEHKTIKLSTLESRLLVILMANRNRVLESQLLVERVWFGYEETEIRLLKNLIYRLRRKIELDPEQPRYIQTVAGLGYMFFIPE